MMRVKWIFDKFEKRINALFKEGAISTQQQLDEYIRSYFDGVKDAGDLEEEELDEMLETARRMFSEAFYKPYYFTFGIWHMYPYPYNDGYIILYEESRKRAVEEYKRRYPNPVDPNVVNCTEIYDAIEWRMLCQRNHRYSMVSPLNVIGKAGYFYVERSE